MPTKLAAVPPISPAKITYAAAVAPAPPKLIALADVMKRPDAKRVLDGNQNILASGSHLDSHPRYSVRNLKTGVITNKVYVPPVVKTNLASPVGALPPVTLTPPLPADIGTTSDYSKNILWTQDTGSNDTAIEQDIEQWQVSDCYVLAPIDSFRVFAEWFLPFILSRDPVAGMFNVTFRSLLRPQTTVVKVNGVLGDVAAKVNPVSGAIGTPLIEKAYAALRTGANTYSSLNYGFIGSTYNEFGCATIFPSLYDPSLLTMLQAIAAKGQCFGIGTNGTIAPGVPLVEAHAYTFLGFDANDNIRLLNPWGPNYDVNGVTTVTLAQLIANASSTALATSWPVAKPAESADINEDGVVDFNDLTLLEQEYNRQVAAGKEGDIDGNGTVDFADLLLLLQTYNVYVISQSTK